MRRCRTKRPVRAVAAVSRRLRKSDGVRCSVLYTSSKGAPREGTRPTNPCRPGPLPTGRQALTRRRGLMVLCMGVRRFLLALFACVALAAACLAGDEPGVSFRNDVMAVLSKAGCNAGGCHGNASGKAGFKLSLRGEDPAWDFAALTRDQFGRRVNGQEPDQSLVLLKPMTILAHEGGKRFDKDSPEYRTLRDWLTAGASNDLDTAPKLRQLQVTPRDQ